MAYLIAVLVALAFLVGFVALTQYESRRGFRLFAHARAELDAQVGRIEFIVEHVDLAAFVREEAHHAVNRIGHWVAHLSLQVVRAVERFLTRLVRHLRRRNEETVAPRENAREFVKTLSDFKETINAVHPEIDASEVQ